MPSPPKNSCLDPFLLARIASLQLRAHTVVDGFISGLHQSSFFGHSIEFAQHREYTLGDEPKYMDWKVYGKTDRLYVKQYQQESNLRFYLVLDTSGSMAFKGAKSAFSKFDYCATIAASLAYLALRQGDSVGLVYSKQKSVQEIPPRSAMPHLNALLSDLEVIEPQGEETLAACLQHLVGVSKKRAFILVLSDLLDDEAALLKAFQFVKFKKHELVVVHTLDPDEKNFPYQGNVQFQSLEKSEQLFLDARLYADEYREAVNRLIQTYRTALNNYGVDYFFYTTDTALDLLLRQILNHQK